jgi:hypothetical protein
MELKARAGRTAGRVLYKRADMIKEEVEVAIKPLLVAALPHFLKFCAASLIMTK